MSELRSDTITREMLLDPFIEVLVGFGFSETGRQMRDALRITLVDHLWPIDNSPESLTRKYTLEEEAEERLKKDCQVRGEPEGEKPQVISASRPTVGRRIRDRASVSWLAWLFDGSNRTFTEGKLFDRLLRSYRDAVDRWVDAIRSEELLATENPSMVQMEKWDAAGFVLHDAELAAQKARDRYKNALRKKNYGF